MFSSPNSRKPQSVSQGRLLLSNLSDLGMLMTQSFNRPVQLAKRIFLVVVTFVVVFSLFRYFTRTDPAVTQRMEAGKSYQKAEMKELYRSFAEVEEKGTDSEKLAALSTRGVACTMVGMFCTDNPEDHSAGFKDSAMGGLAKLVVLPLKYPPSSFAAIARNTLENAGFVPKTYAQGIGFSALTTFQPIWKAFRDLAYLLIVVVMVGVGFMIMFQIGGGENAVTLESALPRLVIALLAIAFSYAIAGFFIDLMYISIAFVVQLLGNQAGLSPLQIGQMSGQIIGGQPNDLFWNLVFGDTWTNYRYDMLADNLYALLPQYMQVLIESIVGAFAMRLIYLVGTNKITTAVGAPGAAAGSKDAFEKAFKNLGPLKKLAVSLQAIITKSVDVAKTADATTQTLAKSGSGTLAVSTIAGLLGLIIPLALTLVLSTPILIKYILATILMFGMIFIFFRMMVMVFTIYTEILVSIFFAPIILMFEAIPGQNMFVKWMQGLLVNLAVYPLITGVFLISRIIISYGNVGVMWSPPFASTLGDQSSLQMIVGAMLVYSIPDLVKKFRTTFGGTSLLGDLNIGIGSLLVGAAPIIGAGKTVLGATGLGNIITRTLSEPFTKMAGYTTDQYGKVFKAGGIKGPETSHGGP